MKKRIVSLLLLLVFSLSITACESKTDNTRRKSKTENNKSDKDDDDESDDKSDKDDGDESDDKSDKDNEESDNKLDDDDNEELVEETDYSYYEAFINNECGAYNFNGDLFYFEDLNSNEEDWLEYVIVEDDMYVDADNDGLDELIMWGPYGAAIIDERGGNLYLLAEGDGTAAVLTYLYNNGEAYLVYLDTSHMGRQTYEFHKYEGSTEVDCFVLSAEYWDSPYDRYDANSDFRYKGKSISMEEYEEILQSYTKSK